MSGLATAAAAARPRNDSPVPLVSRAQSFGTPWAARTDAIGQMDTMATNGTVHGLVSRTSTAVGRTEWKLYRKARSGKEEDRQQVTRHAALKLLSDPNDFYSRMRLFETLQQHQDLTGEAWLVVARNKRMRLPLELWPVRPDRMHPVPHPTKYLSGYLYIAPDGEQVPLELDEVIPSLLPNPTNPYRGLGPVQSVLTEIHSARFATEWNKNFFLNSAQPGGILEVDRTLSDEEFEQLRMRWNEQHKGVAAAHRVAILEQGKWVDRKVTQKDMQFTELRGVTRDQILEAFGFPKPMLGIIEDANRANTQDSEEIFARWLTVPRLDRWRDLLNRFLLPMFGHTTRDLEIDYDSPVPADREADDRARNSKVDAWVKLVNAGVDPDSASDAMELPQLQVRTPEPAEPAPEQDVASMAAQLLRQLDANPTATTTRRHPVHNGPPLEDPPPGWPLFDVDAVEDIDLEPVQSAWEAALAALLRAWRSTVIPGWIDQLVEAVRAVVRGDGGTFTDLTVDASEATRILATAMRELADTAAGHAVNEADAKDVTLQQATPPQTDLEESAREIVDTEAARYALSAGREATRVRVDSSTPDDVANEVRNHLENDVTLAGAETALGGALTEAQNRARFATFRTGPEGALYAVETLDLRTCRPCREIHGRWIANISDLTALHKLYPAGGYVDCRGRWRCRGTVTGVWRPRTTQDGGAE